MRIPFTNIDDSPPINIKMYDYDQYSNDEFIGVCYIDLKNAQYERNLFYNLNKIPTPTWYNLSYRNGIPGGKILLGFNLFVNETIPPSLPSLLPPYEKYNIKIKALGVRGLQQVGIYSIKKPLVVFNVDSMRDPNCKINLPEKNLLIAEAKNYGPDANFSTIVKYGFFFEITQFILNSFSLDLPRNALLWPNLNVFHLIFKTYFLISVSSKTAYGKTRLSPF